MPHRADDAPGFKAIRFNADWITRPLFGIALAAAVVAAVFGGGPFIAALGALAGVAAAREWHRMVGERVFGPAFYMSAITVVLALAGQAIVPHGVVGWTILLCGAGIVGAYALTSHMHAFWHGLGPIYIATAPLMLVMLRGVPHGAWIIIGLFLAIWSTDTAALIVGNLVGGPRLWPSLSPNKTWSGTLGAVVVAAVVEAIFIKILGGNAIEAGLYGAAVAILSHAGDLFESWIKRVFHLKDSGGMIPGHGGVLDRVDSTLVAAPVIASLVLFAGLNPMFGAHP